MNVISLEVTEGEPNLLFLNDYFVPCKNLLSFCPGYRQPSIVSSQGSPQAAGSGTSAVPYSERDCLDPNHYWATCGCRTPGWVDRMITINGRFYHSGNFELDSIADDPNLPNFGPTTSYPTHSPTTSTPTFSPTPEECVVSALKDLATTGTSLIYGTNQYGNQAYDVSCSSADPLDCRFLQYQVAIVGDYTGTEGNDALFDGGAYCSAISASRSGKVVFTEDCSAGGLTVTSVTEPSTCYYVMNVNGLCCEPSPVSSTTTTTPPPPSTTTGTTTQATTTQAMGVCVNAGSMDGESCLDTAACGCTRRNLLSHEDHEEDQEEVGMEDVKNNLRQRELQRGCKCQPNRGKFCCPNAGETCESDGVCRASATTTIPVTTIGSTTTVSQTTSTTTQAVCTCEFGTTSTESPPATTTTTLPPPQTSTTASSCAPAGAKCQEVSRCCNGCQDSGRRADRQCL